MGGRLRTQQQSARLVRLATLGVVAYSVSPPLVGLFRVITLDPAHAAHGLAATACYLSLQTWLVFSGARGNRPRHAPAALTAAAVVVIAMIPVMGIHWFGAIQSWAALVLIVLRPPWSFLLFAGVAAAMTPLTFAVGAPQWAVYFTLGTFLLGMTLAAPVWLIRAIRELDAARLALADEAVIRERLRIDAELRHTVGYAMEKIVVRGDRVYMLAADDPASTRAELIALAEDSRRTRAQVQRMVLRYRHVSVAAELETAATLLSAAGIRTDVVLPPDGLPDEAQDALRSSLRAAVIRLLAEEGARRCVITITLDGVMEVRSA